MEIKTLNEIEILADDLKSKGYDQEHEDINIEVTVRLEIEDMKRLLGKDIMLNDEVPYSTKSGLVINLKAK